MSVFSDAYKYDNFMELQDQLHYQIGGLSPEMFKVPPLPPNEWMHHKIHDIWNSWTEEEQQQLYEHAPGCITFIRDECIPNSIRFMSL